MSSEFYIVLRHKIEEKVKQIEIYRKHMERDDLPESAKEEYKGII